MADHPDRLNSMSHSISPLSDLVESCCGAPSSFFDSSVLVAAPSEAGSSPADTGRAGSMKSERIKTTEPRSRLRLMGGPPAGAIVSTAHWVRVAEVYHRGTVAPAKAAA